MLQKSPRAKRESFEVDDVLISFQKCLATTTKKEQKLSSIKAQKVLNMCGMADNVVIMRHSYAL